MTKKEEKEYLAKWLPRIERMRVLGLRVYGFDRGVSVLPLDDSGTYHCGVHIPEWLLVILEDMATRLYPETADDKAILRRREERLSRKEKKARKS